MEREINVQTFENHSNSRVCFRSGVLDRDLVFCFLEDIACSPSIKSVSFNKKWRCIELCRDKPAAIFFDPPDGVPSVFYPAFIV